MRYILVKGTGIVSKLIRWQTRGQYSHAALLFSDNVVIESRERHYDIATKKHTSGVQKVSFDYWKQLIGDAPFTVFDVEPITNDDESKIRAFAESQIGKPYDYLGVLRFITRKNYQSQPDDKWWCSELVFQAIAEVVLLFANTEGWWVNPDLLQRTPLSASETQHLTAPKESSSPAK